MDLPQHIKSHENLLEAARLVGREDRDLGRALRIVERQIGPLPDRMRPQGFSSLLFLIVAQQVSVHSAQAIWRRIEGGVSPLTPQGWMALAPRTLDTLGLSKPKKIYAAALAEAITSGTLDLGGLDALSPQAAEEKLLRVKGIGPWTAKAYLLFSHGHVDAWPAGDIALQAAAQHLLGLDARPGTQSLEDIGEAWRPWRGVAAHILWAYYKTI